MCIIMFHSRAGLAYSTCMDYHLRELPLCLPNPIFWLKTPGSLMEPKQRVDQILLKYFSYRENQVNTFYHTMSKFAQSQAAAWKLKREAENFNFYAMIQISIILRWSIFWWILPGQIIQGLLESHCEILKLPEMVATCALYPRFLLLDLWFV